WVGVWGSWCVCDVVCGGGVEGGGQGVGVRWLVGGVVVVVLGGRGGGGGLLGVVGGVVGLAWGVLGCRVMLVNGLLVLADAGIVRRKVYADAELQRMANMGTLDEDAHPDG
ncbi:hypothetical protein, partial [Pseudomonas syringae group genomosp. 7]|uniref:hypothetical protein n=1 Tax=Pseudomonas syringae group genomosp. 7 TaxID=251699 RepID=UPI00376FD7BA